MRAGIVQASSKTMKPPVSLHFLPREFEARNRTTKARAVFEAENIWYAWGAPDEYRGRISQMLYLQKYYRKEKNNPLLSVSYSKLMVTCGTGHSLQYKVNRVRNSSVHI